MPIKPFTHSCCCINNTQRTQNLLKCLTCLRSGADHETSGNINSKPSLNPSVESSNGDYFLEGVLQLNSCTSWRATMSVYMYIMKKKCYGLLKKQKFYPSHNGEIMCGITRWWRVMSRRASNQWCHKHTRTAAIGSSKAFTIIFKTQQRHSGNITQRIISLNIC